MKNAAEIAGLVHSGVRAAAAIVSFISWLNAQLLESSPVSGSQAADQMFKMRIAHADCVGNSFPTISSSGSNAVVIHYQTEARKYRL